MKKVVAFISYLLIAIYFVIVFFPKVNLYYKAEELLHSKQVVITGESLNDKGLVFSIQEAKVFYNDLFVGEFSQVDVDMFLVYNALHIDAFTLSSEMKQFVPQEVEYITVSHSIIDPLHVNIEASGEFGDVNGSVNLAERKLSLSLLISPQLKKQNPFWLRKLKKVGGTYQYELRY